jgi:hypothetical protein
MLPAVQELEIRDACFVAHHRLAINGRVLRQGEYGLADQRIALGPIVSAPGDTRTRPARRKTISRYS